MAVLYIGFSTAAGRRCVWNLLCLFSRCLRLPTEPLPRNGTYSKVFGKWSQLKPAAVLDKIFTELDGCNFLKKSHVAKSLVACLSCDVAVVNACKCIHVLKTLSDQVSITKFVLGNPVHFLLAFVFSVQCHSNLRNFCFVGRRFSDSEP